MMTNTNHAAPSTMKATHAKGEAEVAAPVTAAAAFDTLVEALQPPRVEGHDDDQRYPCSAATTTTVTVFLLVVAAALSHVLRVKQDIMYPSLLLRRAHKGRW